MIIYIREDRNIEKEQIISLYEANQWASAKKPDQLFQALLHSHSLITAWDQDKLIGLGNALSDGYLVVYYPHFLVHPEYQGKGVGKRIMDKLQEVYGNFHQQILVADGEAVGFYKKCGFEKASQTESMWIYQAKDH